MKCLPGKHVWVRDIHYKGAGIRHECRQCGAEKFSK